jgi:hypothetical protein
MVDVAQLVRASDCDSEGRGFEPRLSPNSRCNKVHGEFFLVHSPGILVESNDDAMHQFTCLFFSAANPNTSLNKEITRFFREKIVNHL